MDSTYSFFSLLATTSELLLVICPLFSLSVCLNLIYNYVLICFLFLFFLIFLWILPTAGIVKIDRAQTPLQPNLNSHNVFSNNQNEILSIEPRPSVWPPQRPSLQDLAAYHQVVNNLPPHAYRTGQSSLHGNGSFQQATDSSSNTTAYRENPLPSASNLQRDNLITQSSSEVWSPEPRRHSEFSTTHAQPSYPVQHSSVPSTPANLATGLYPTSVTPYPEEQFKTPTEQESAWKYPSQYSVPFGQQEQSPEVHKDEENTQWKDDKVEVVHLPDPLQSIPSSYDLMNSQWEEQKLNDKIKEVNLSDPPQSPPGSFSMENMGEDIAGHDKIKPGNSSDLPHFSSNSSRTAMEISGGTSEDKGQDNFSANGQEKEAQNETLDNSDPTVGRTRSRSQTDGGSTANRSPAHQHRNSQPCTEKVPVERVMSNDYDVEDAQHLHHKCPVEMSYKCISRYFNSGGKNLGEGGFGTVYEGMVVK